jgi:hypothetical protein
MKKFAPWLYWFLAAVSSLQFAITYVVTQKGFKFVDFAMGQVTYPFRRRIFMAYVYRGFLRLGLHVHFKTSSLGANEIFSIVVNAAMLLLAIAVARFWIREMIGQDSPWEWMSLLVIWVTNYHFLLTPEMHWQTPYDVPSMAFFGLASYAAFTRNRWLFYPVFLIATTNRESTIFLPMVFFLFGLGSAGSLWQALKSTRVALVLETLAQFLLWYVVNQTCIYVSGGPEPSLSLYRINFHLLINPTHWPTYFSLFGFLWIPYALFFDRIGNQRMKRIAWLAIPWAMVMFKLSDPLEIRVNSEWVVYGVVCLSLISKNSIQPFLSKAPTTETFDGRLAEFPGDLQQHQ